MNLSLRARVEVPAGSDSWEAVLQQRSADPAKTAIVICDVWDDHWCRAAAKRCAVIARKVARTVDAARTAGAHVVHAPSGCMDFYADFPQRRRMLEMELIDPPPESQVAEGDFPIAAPPDQGC